MPKLTKNPAAAGDPQASLEQIFRGDHAIVHQALNEANGTPKIQPVLRKNWNDKQARSVMITLSPVELESPDLANPAVFFQTGPVTGILTWGVEGGDSKNVEFDWGSAWYNPGGNPDGRGAGLQLSVLASYIQLDARNWMGTPAVIGGGFPDPAGTAIVPKDAILRAFLTVGAATQRLTPITRTFWVQTPVVHGGVVAVPIPPMAKRVQVTRAPGLAMTVDVLDAIFGNPTDTLIVIAGARCPIIDLPPDALAVRFTNNDGALSIDRARFIFELAI